MLLVPVVSPAAEKPQLWLYYAVNLSVDKNIDKAEQIWGRAVKAGYTHVLLVDSKMAKLGDLGSGTAHYFKNVGRVKKIAADDHLTIVPALFNIGYSNNMLWHDPNLAEGLPVRDQHRPGRPGVHDGAGGQRDEVRQRLPAPPRALRPGGEDDDRPRTGRRAQGEDAMPDRVAHPSTWAVPAAVEASNRVDRHPVARLRR